MTLTLARRARLVPVAAAGLVVLAGLAVAGPLNPPPGPVGSTMKTLTEVEPRIALSATNTPGDFANQFKITQPGSYYLAGDMVASPGSRPCIVVSASDVTLDLSGYSIRTAASEGVSIAGDRVTVRNGRITLSGTVSAGVLVQTGADDARIEGLTVTVAGTDSAGVRGSAGVASVTVRDSIFLGGAYGIRSLDNSVAWTVSDVQCRGHSTWGISTGKRSVIERCVVRDVSNAAGSSFTYGIYVDEDSVVRDSQVIDSRVTGSVGPAKAILVGTDSVVENCLVTSRGTVGIALNGGRIEVKNCRVTMLNSGATGIKNLLGGDSIVDSYIFAPSGTGIQLDGVNTVVIRNRIKNATTPIAGVSLASNVIGPTASDGNPTTSTNPHANVID